YNRGKITLAQYNAGVNNYNAMVYTYNTYVGTRNASTEVSDTNSAIHTFNQNTSFLNSEINAANASLGNSGVPPLSNQSPYAAAVSPLPSIPSVPTQPTTPPSNPLFVSFLPDPGLLPAADNTIHPPPKEASTLVEQLFAPVYLEVFARLLLTQTFLSVYTSY